MKKKIKYLTILVLFIITFIGCSENRCILNGCFFRPINLGAIPIVFVSENNTINENVLIPIDVIVTENSDAILEIGPENWFAHPKRDSLLNNELYRMTISGWDTHKLWLKPDSFIRKIIIFADYENLHDRDGQQLVLFPKMMDFTYTIKITSNGMELIK